VDVGEDVREYLVGFAFGDGEVVDDDVGEFDLSHAFELSSAHALNIIHNSSENNHFYNSFSLLLRFLPVIAKPPKLVLYIIVL
jgi:hypothetical protein